MTVEYGPRRFNSVTVTMLLLAIVAGYCAWVFLPPYFDSWNVDHELREAAAETYRVVRLPEPTRTKELTRIAEKSRLAMIKQGQITDPDFAVGLDLGENKVTMTADYHAPVTLPLLGKTLKLHFHLVEVADTKKVKWD